MKLIRALIFLPILCLTVFPGLLLAATTPSGLQGAEIEPGTVRWEWGATDDAIEYEVTVDGVFVGTTDSTFWVSEDLWVGNHSLTVKGVDDSGELSVQSETLKIPVLRDSVEPSADLTEPSELSEPAELSEPTELAEPTELTEPSEPPASASSADTGLIDPSSYNYPEVTGKSGYELVFSDEFNANALNPARWHSQLRWDGEWNGERYEYRLINGENQFYVNVLSPDEEHQREILPVANPFEFNGNRLAIRATINPLKSSDNNRTHGALMDIVRQQEFLSGAISTHKKFSRKHGYFEARIKIPGHVGTFPAFWLFHEKRSWEGTQRTEIDIMENLGHAPHYIYNSFHYFKNVTETYSGDANFIKPKPSGQIFTGIDYSADYHVYAVEWEPGKVTWFIDGQQVSELENSEISHEDLYLMINLAMGGNWTNFPENAGGLGRSSDQRFPTANDIREFKNPALEIDYVRVYRRR